LWRKYKVVQIWKAKRVSLEKQKKWQHICIAEMKAFLGILLHAGADKNWNVPFREIITTICTNSVFRESISVNSFENIRRYLRSDDRRTREDRLQTYNLAFIGYTWEAFIQQYRKVFVTNEHATVEQLVSLRGRCEFKQYMPNKPGKYCLKILWMCDSSLGYAVHGLFYKGRKVGRPLQKET